MEPSFQMERITGLTQKEAAEKIEKEGYNELPSSKPKSLFNIAVSVVKEPMFLLLVACGTLYLTLGDIHEGLMLLSFVFVIMGIEFYQEKKTEKALDALKDLASPRALVIRDGETIRISGKEVVTGDIVILKEGDRVPADGIVMSSTNLLADESLLTGESVPVRKREWAEGDSIFIPGGDDIPVVYSGSMIVQGTGFVKITATAINTEIGKIGKALDSVKGRTHPAKKGNGYFSETPRYYRYSSVHTGNCHIYTYTRRFIERFSCGYHPGNGDASRGISSRLNHFPCSWSMADV